MPYIKLVNETYSNSDAIKNVYNYMTNAVKTNGLTGGYNVVPAYSVQMMRTVKKLYGKDDGKQLLHIIISLSEKENISEEAMYRISLHIASFFRDYQVVFSVHSNTGHIHTHFMVNTVSFRDGSRINENEIKCSLEKICAEIFPA